MDHLDVRELNPWTREPFHPADEAEPLGLAGQQLVGGMAQWVAHHLQAVLAQQTAQAAAAAATAAVAAPPTERWPLGSAEEKHETAGSIHGHSPPSGAPSL